MDYKSKIKEFKAGTDKGAWKSMENLLDVDNTAPTRSNTNLFSWANHWITKVLGVFAISLVVWYAFNFFGINAPISVSESISSETSIDGLKDVALEQEVSDTKTDDFSKANEGQIAIAKESLVESEETAVTQKQLFANRTKTSNSTPPTTLVNSAEQTSPVGEKTVANESFMTFNSSLDVSTNAGQNPINNASTTGVPSNFLGNSQAAFTSSLSRESKTESLLQPLHQPLQLFPIDLFEINADIIDIPIRSIFQPRYSVGFDFGLGETNHYIDRLYGNSYTVYGSYHIKRWLRTGLRINTIRVIEAGDYSINPEVKTSIQQTAFSGLVQLVPLHWWRIELGLEGSFGFNLYREKVRTIENLTPNMLEYKHHTISNSKASYYYGVFLSCNITDRSQMGLSVGQEFNNIIIQTLRLQYMF